MRLFRVALPITLTLIGAVFGAIGLVQRSAILSQRWLGDQTLWQTTARFHVWPWPYKFAAILNLPAILGGGLISLLLDMIRPNLPEMAQYVPPVLVAALLWYWVGSRLDRHFGEQRRYVWPVVGVFVLVCLGGAFLPLGYIGYLWFGMIVWIAAGVLLRRLSQRSATQERESH